MVNRKRPLRDRQNSVIRCSCAPINDSHCPTGVCHTNSSCYASHRQHVTSGLILHSFTNLGCFPNLTVGHHELDRMQCLTDANQVLSSDGSHVNHVLCCGDHDMCNRNLTAQQPTSSTNKLGNYNSSEDHDLPISTVILLSTITCLLSLAIMVSVYLVWKYCRKSKRPMLSDEYILQKQQPPQQLINNRPYVYTSIMESSNSFPVSLSSAAGSQAPTETLTITGTSWPLSSLSAAGIVDQSSGSGSGAPFLVQRTVAHQITLESCVGRGRYGSVWTGNLHGETVAIKIFCSRDEASWNREAHMYNDVLIRHENILAFYASDMTSSNGCTQLWLITQYHSLGSLHDYLQVSPPLTPFAALWLVLGATSGLCYLHSEICGLRGKPAVAHRDVKSRNILVKSNLSCCIADLGLAVVAKQGCDEPPELPPNSNRVGTKRYMPPEVLCDSLDHRDFEAFKSADMYSLGLVLWEVSRRIEVDGVVDDYQLPYQMDVCSDPSYEQMKDLVCVKGCRPHAPPRLTNHPHLSAYVDLMNECWHAAAVARVTALYTKKTLLKLVDTLQKSLD